MPAYTSPSMAAADQELCRRVLGELAETHRLSLQRLAVEVHHGIVHLRGCVKTFYEKQLAIRSCIRAAGAGRLVDAVEVPAG
jgi:osmotically-inducible protein OsmY